MKTILFTLHPFEMGYGFCLKGLDPTNRGPVHKSIAYVEGGSMRKKNFFLMTAITLALFAGVAFGQVNDVAAQKEGPVGIVVAYIPGQSITIVDQQGVQSEFMLDPSLKILPLGGEKTLTVGSFVTLIAPASLDKGKQVAVGIVIHPKVPDGWTKKVLAPSGTPQVKNTADATGTLSTDGSKPLMTETPTPSVPSDATITPTALEPSKMTPTATPLGGASTKVTNESFIQWLTSLIRQVLAGQ